MEPGLPEGIDVGGGPESAASASEGRPRQPTLPDPASHGLIVGPEFMAHPLDPPRFRGEGFELEVEAAVALLVGPVGVEAVEEAVGVGRGDGVDAGAAGDAVAVGGIEGGEGDVAGGVEDDGDDVVLAGAEAEEGVGWSCGEDGGGEDLRCEVGGVSGEVAEEAFEASGCGGTTCGIWQKRREPLTPRPRCRGAASPVPR